MQRARALTASRANASAPVLVDPLTVQPMLAQTLATLGFSPFRIATAPISIKPAATIITVERFFHDTLRQQAWIAAGHRVLPLLFDDDAVTVGPLCDGSGVCGSCCNEAMAAGNPLWRERALMRMGQRAASETPEPLAMIAGFLSLVLSMTPSQTQELSVTQYVLQCTSTVPPTLSAQRIDVHTACPNHAASPRH